MDAFEVKDKSTRSARGDSRIKRKSRICVGIVGAVAVIGITSVIVHSFLQHNELQSNVEHLGVAESDNELQSTVEHLGVAGSDDLPDTRCGNEFCVTKGCITEAARMVHIMNTAVSPCEDFYEYACGNYKPKRALGFQEESYDPLKEVEDDIIVSLKSIMDTPVRDDESDSFKKLRILFFSCANTDRRDNASVDDFSKFLTDINLHWPVLSGNSHDDGNDWKLIVRKLEKDYSIHTLFQRSNEIRYKNPFGNETLQCEVPTLPVEAYLYHNGSDKPFIMKMYAKLLDITLESLNIDSDRGKEFIAEIINLETELARSLAETSEESGVQPSRDLVEIFEGNAERVDELVGHVYPKCSGNVNKILEVLEKQPDKIVKDYLGWRTLYSVMRLLTSHMKHLSDAYTATFPGSLPEYSANFRECVFGIRDEMDLVATKAYYDGGFFTEQQEAEVRAMMSEMNMATVSLLKTMPWMDNNTFSVFQDKLMNMKLIIGYPENIRNGHVVDDLFHDLEINENDTYFLNVMKVRKHVAHLLDSGYRNHSTDRYPLKVDSNYFSIKNTVDIKHGFLGSPVVLYGDDYPKYLKYGHYFQAAHDMGHYFDTFSTQLNAHGEREGTDWWPDAVKDKYFDYVRCVRQQEAIKFGVDIIDTDIRQTDQDIANPIAFYITYASLLTHLKMHGEEEKPLPGLNLDKKQTFLVQAAQIDCDFREPGSNLNPFSGIPETGKDRVNDGLRNFEDFGVIFNCPVGSPMNPAHKCNLLR